MRRLLLVDDEPQVLLTLQASMQPLAEEWDVAFLPGGKEALSWLEQHEADVVLADIHMPGMSGLELLSEVKGRYPRTVRMAFSGVAHQEMVMKGLSVAHQVLPKPLAPSTLRTTLSRACAQRDVLGNPALQQLVGSIQHLPSLPTIYQEIEATLQAKDASAEKTAAIIGKDPAMVTNLLHLVNSAYFSLRRTVSSPTHAVALLGIGTVKSLVLTLKLFEQSHRDPALKPLIERLWQHGITVGTAAKALAVAEDMGTVAVEAAFLGGLLHDLGRLVLASNLPKEQAQVDNAVRAGTDPVEAERTVYGATHAEVGAYLLSIWGLNDLIVEGVAFHHCPMVSHSGSFTVLTAIHLANGWAGSSSGAGARSEPDLAYIEQLGLSDRLPKWKALCHPA